MYAAICNRISKKHAISDETLTEPKLSLVQDFPGPLDATQKLESRAERSSVAEANLSGATCDKWQEKVRLMRARGGCLLDRKISRSRFMTVHALTHIAPSYWGMAEP